MIPTSVAFSGRNTRWHKGQRDATGDARAIGAAMYPSDQATAPHRFADPIVSSRVSALQWGHERMRVGPGVIAES
jgi:hypothetical protein